jgi:putative DNA primase/helicase
MAVGLAEYQKKMGTDHRLPCPHLFSTKHFTKEQYAMITNGIYLAKLVSDYIAQDFSPIPICYKSKRPVNKGWTNLKIATNDIGKYFNGQPTNIGVLTGQPSKGLVDVDIDHTTALRFAPWFLPETKCVFGRASKPKGHWVYRVPDSQTQETFQSTGMIVEVRGNKRCTVFPGSIHESDEPVEFEDPNNYEPGSATWNELRRAASKIAIATALSRAWMSGPRHDLALYTAAKLARLGWNVAEVRHLIAAVATEAKDEELDDRLLAVDTTFEKYNRRQSISGEKDFTELLGETMAKNIDDWASPSKTLKRAKSKSIVPDLASDTGAADAFAAKFKGDLIFCDDNGWLLRENQVFEPISPAIVQGLTKNFLQDEVGKVTAGPVAYSPLKSCLTRARINAVIELSRAQRHVQSNTLDENRDLAGCSDGYVLDLNTGSMISDGLNSVVTKKLGTNFTEGSTCPEWTKFLQRIFDEDSELITFIQRAVGYSLTGSVSEQCLFILIGTGANGKSTFLRVLQHLLGDYAGTIPMQGLMEQRYGSQTNDLAHLFGKRLVVASEGERGQRLAESQIKMMTGGDRIACRPLYKNLFEYVPEFKLWLATNDLPTISGMEDAIWRRIRVIEFPITIHPDQQDKTLADRLIKELPGILQWALKGLSEWRKTGLAPPDCVLQATRSYREDNDTVGQWIESACVCEPKLRTSMRDLFDSYKSWCDDSSLESLHNASFGKELTRLGFKIHKSNKCNYRNGIGLKQPPDITTDVASSFSTSWPAHMMPSRRSGQSLN